MYIFVERGENFQSAGPERGYMAQCVNRSVATDKGRVHHLDVMLESRRSENRHRRDGRKSVVIPRGQERLYQFS
jgi:hypothetical protein